MIDFMDVRNCCAIIGLYWFDKKGRLCVSSNKSAIQIEVKLAERFVTNLNSSTVTRDRVVFISISAYLSRANILPLSLPAFAFISRCNREIK